MHWYCDSSAESSYLENRFTHERKYTHACTHTHTDKQIHAHVYRRVHIHARIYTTKGQEQTRTISIRRSKFHGIRGNMRASRVKLTRTCHRQPFLITSKLDETGQLGLRERFEHLPEESDVRHAVVDAGLAHGVLLWMHTSTQINTRIDLHTYTGC